MGCEECREELSAQLDGERRPQLRSRVGAHLAGCPGCRRWYEDAARVTRLARTSRVRPATTPVDVTGVVLPAAPGPGRARLASGLRLALGAVGIAQLGLAVQQVATAGIADGHVHGDTVVSGTTAGHLWHESAAWGIAVGAAFLWIVLRSGRPTGVVPILTVFVGIMALLNIDDATSGRLEPSHLASHVFVLTGYVLVVALSRPSLTMPDPRPPPPRRPPATDPRGRLAGRAGAGLSPARPRTGRAAHRQPPAA